MLFDSHAHINNDTYTREDREALIRDIEASDLSYVMDIGFDLKKFKTGRRTCADIPMVLCCGRGVHPHDADTMTEEVLSEIRTLAGEEKR